MMKHYRSDIDQIRIDKVVSEVFRVKVSNFHSTSTKRENKDPRLAAMFLQKKLLRKSFPAIASHFHKKSHTTCLSAFRTAVGLYETDKNFRSKIDQCIEKYSNYQIDQVKQRYNLHHLITSAGIKVSGPDCTVYIAQEKYDSLSGTLKDRIDRLIKSHHYSLQLTII